MVTGGGGTMVEGIAAGVPVMAPVLALKVSPLDRAGLMLYVVSPAGVSEGVFGAIAVAAT
jgi:hypothetical protein